MILIMYFALLAVAIVLLLLAVIKKKRIFFIVSYTVQTVFLVLSIVLAKYFDSLPKTGMMPGLVYFSEILFSILASWVFAGLLIITTALLIVLYVKSKRKGKGE